MPKTCCFLTSFFSGFGLDFGASWASKMEPSWLQIAISSILDALFGDPKFNMAKNVVLERSGLDFGASGPRFWRLWASILADFKEFWDRFFGNKLARKCFLPAGSD